MKKILIYITIVAISSILNISIFLIAYKKLAFPYLVEDQRMENAPLIFIYVIPSFFLVSVVVVFFIQKINKLKA